MRKAWKVFRFLLTLAWIWIQAPAFAFAFYALAPHGSDPATGLAFTIMGWSLGMIVGRWHDAYFSAAARHEEL